MITNERLILGMAPREERWEDQEKANHDVESMTREFRARLHGGSGVMPTFAGSKGSGLLSDLHNPFAEGQQ